MYFQKVKVNLGSPLDLRSNNKFSCLTTHQDEEKQDEEIARLPAMSSSTETDDECVDFGDVVVGFFVFQLMALHENEVLFGALDEEQGDEDEEDIQFHLPSPSGEGDQEGSATVEEQGDEDGEDIEFYLPSLAGGGDQEESEEGMSPPKKRRKRGKGPLSQITRRRKTSKSTEGVTGSEESLVSSSEDNAVSPKMTDKKAAWRNSPKGKSSIAESNKKYHLKNKSIEPLRQASRKYEATDKARSTRSRYEANEGAETRARYEANEGAKTRARYEANEGAETRARYEANKGAETRARYEANKGAETRARYEANKGAETRARYEANKGAETRARYEASHDGKETRKRYKSSQGRLESQASYECSWKGLQTRIRYNSSQGVSAIRDRSRYSSSFKQRTVLYKKQVKNAIKHLIARTAETKPDAETEHGVETEPDTKNEPPHEGAADLSGEESVNPEPGAEKFLTNKNAMATIRSHKVGHLCQLDQINNANLNCNNLLKLWCCNSDLSMPYNIFPGKQALRCEQ